jgi:hypothetical protein
MKYALLFFTLALQVQDIPYKPKEEFDIKLDYQFKQRPVVDRTNTVTLDETRKEYEKRTSSDLLPYLVLNVKFLKVNTEEARVRVTNNIDRRSVSKKIEEGSAISLDLGFTDDIKDRVTAHEYTLTMLSPKKSDVSKIVIHIEEDGSFLVNGEKRGRF